MSERVVVCCRWCDLGIDPFTYLAAAEKLVAQARGRGAELIVGGVGELCFALAAEPEPDVEAFVDAVHRGGELWAIGAARGQFEERTLQGATLYFGEALVQAKSLAQRAGPGSTVSFAPAVEEASTVGEARAVEEVSGATRLPRVAPEFPSGALVALRSGQPQPVAEHADTLERAGQLVPSHRLRAVASLVAGDPIAAVQQSWEAQAVARGREGVDHAQLALLHAATLAAVGQARASLFEALRALGCARRVADTRAERSSLHLLVTISRAAGREGAALTWQVQLDELDGRRSPSGLEAG
jgi:hypothetical protein